jgi:hypothetical protein
VFDNALFQPQVQNLNWPLDIRSLYRFAGKLQPFAGTRTDRGS